LRTFSGRRVAQRGISPVWYIRWLATKNLAPGTIVILHDGISNPSRIIEALPQILAAAPRKGLRVVSIAALKLAAAPSNCG